jgi:MFS transporter, DHA1 family, multidrug resistance protein
LQIAPKSRGFTVVLGLFAALPALSIDLSAPTLPLLPHALGTSRAVAGLTLSLFMVGFAVGQLGGGSLSDGQGRRPALLSGLAGFTVAGVSCALAVSGSTLAFSRLIQGFCAGVCSVVAFAMVQDLFEGDTARAKRSYVTMIFTAVPILAPALGSVLTDRFGWRSVHGILAVGGGLLLVVTWFGVAESRFPSLDVPPITDRTTARIWEDSSFVCITLANALSYACIFAYIAGSPVVIIGQMGLPSTVFAGVFACTAIALAAGAWTSGQLSRRGVATAALLDVSLVVRHRGRHDRRALAYGRAVYPRSHRPEYAAPGNRASAGTSRRGLGGHRRLTALGRRRSQCRGSRSVANAWHGRGSLSHGAAGNSRAAPLALDPPMN